jgi:hypothetical protein
VVGHDLGLGQFEVFVFTDFREDGFETFLRLPRQVLVGFIPAPKGEAFAPNFP